ncbi:hypothetical protein PHMEG_00036742, partial [Phytophthora megakarya]
LEIKGLWADVNEPTPAEDLLKAESDAVKAAAAAAAQGGTSTTAMMPPTPLSDRLMKQKMASSIILAALNEKIAAEVYLMDHPLAMLRHLRLTYNVKSQEQGHGHGHCDHSIDLAAAVDIEMTSR